MPIATELPGRPGVVAYPVCAGGSACRIWVVNDDGTGPHELLPDELGQNPESLDCQRDAFSCPFLLLRGWFAVVLTLMLSEQRLSTRFA